MIAYLLFRVHQYGAEDGHYLRCTVLKGEKVLRRTEREDAGNSGGREGITKRANERRQHHVLTCLGLQVAGNFAETNNGVRANASFGIFKLNPGKVLHYFFIEVLTIQFWGHVVDALSS